MNALALSDGFLTVIVKDEELASAWLNLGIDSRRRILRANPELSLAGYN